MPTHIHPFLQFTVIIGYLNVGLLVGSLCSGLFVDCSILLQFTCKAVSPGTHFVSAGFPVLSGALSDVGTEIFRFWKWIFMFWNHNEDFYFAVFRLCHNFCLKILIRTWRWLSDLVFTLLLSASRRPLAWLWLSSSRVLFIYEMTIITSSATIFTIICSSIQYGLYIHLFIDKMIVITLATLFTIFRSSLLWDH